MTTETPPPASTPPTGPPGGSQWSATGVDRPVPGAAGFVYADLPNRIFAFIIDIIVFIVIALILGLLLATFLPAATVDPNNPLGTVVDPVTGLVTTIVNTLIGAAYFVYFWTAMRGTPGMKLLGMQIGNAADGSTVTLNTAITRYAVMFGPGLLAQLVGAFVPALGLILSLAALAWLIALLVTTAQSTTKQGLHDRYANTVVVKASRSVA